jgi:glutaredoxin
VTLLTQPDCAFCEQAAGMLERLSRDYRLEVAELPLTSHEGRSLAERGGIMFPPGIFLDEEAFSYGRPSERRLRRELDQRKARRSTTIPRS